jgi:hypothetical protein
MFAVIFAGCAWLEWHGAWALAMRGFTAAEFGVTPRHRIVLDEGEHWLYLQGQSGGCAPSEGGCQLLGAVAGDLLAGFFARYLPPSELTEAGAAIPPSLVPPQIDLSFQQEFDAGAHLMGLKALQFNEGCRVHTAWATGTGSGEVTLQGS